MRWSNDHITLDRTSTLNLLKKIEDCSITQSIRNTLTRSTRTSLRMFLFKLKTRASSKLLYTVVEISKSSIKRAVSAVRESWVTNFVSHILGFDHISRSEVIENHPRPLAQNLFSYGTEAIFVLDGTYIYLQHSEFFSVPKSDLQHA